VILPEALPNWSHEGPCFSSGSTGWEGDRQGCVLSSSKGRDVLNDARFGPVRHSHPLRLKMMKRTTARMMMISIEAMKPPVVSKPG
jgi:hypothetical protein